MSGATPIRLLRDDEIDDAYALMNEAFRRYLALIGRSPGRLGNPYAYLPEAVADQRAWCATLDNRLAGVAQVNAKPNGHWIIDIVGVPEEFAGRGIGKSLMARIEQDARARNVPTLELNTLEIADWLWQFYQRLGYQITERAPPRHGLDNKTRVYMNKNLKP